MTADYVNASTSARILLKLLKMTVGLLFCCTPVCWSSKVAAVLGHSQIQIHTYFSFPTLVSSKLLVWGGGVN